ncbi:MAG: hypothetical protein ACKOBW_07160 [Planctomycetota bacterium]
MTRAQPAATEPSRLRCFLNACRHAQQQLPQKQLPQAPPQQCPALRNPSVAIANFQFSCSSRFASLAKNSTSYYTA